MDNLNVLVEAKKEYLGQLCHLMTPVMIQVFQDMYDEATKLSKGRQVLIMYQKLLKEVPNWSNAMSKSHSDNITERCAWFSDLLAAVFVACTKILSSVRLNADNKKISLKLPMNEVFIQTVYNNAAKNLYKDPYVYHEEQSEYIRDEKLTTRFSVCIEESIKELIPVQQILQTYMSQESKDIDIGDTEDTEDPDVFEGEPMEEELQPPVEPEVGPEVGPDAEADIQEIAPVEELARPMGSPLDNEFKTINNVQDPQPQDEDVFFGDAPEQRTKKVGYN
jgi:primosomal protein N''